MKCVGPTGIPTQLGTDFLDTSAITRDSDAQISVAMFNAVRKTVFVRLSGCF